MKAKYLIILILPIFLIFSCEEDIEINYKTYYPGDKIIIHGFVSPEDGVQVIVKKTLPPNDVNGDDRINDAVVTLYKNDQEIGQLTKISDYLYVLKDNITYNLGDEFYVSVESKSLGQQAVSASQQIIPPPQIDSVIIKNIDGTNYLLIYYESEVKGKNFLVTTTGYKNGQPDVDTSIMPEFPFANLITAYTQGQNIYSEQFSFYDDDSVVVKFYNISDDFVRFLQSLDNYDFTQDDPFFDYVYPVFSNIKNGYGIFVSFSYKSFTFKIQNIEK